MIASSSELLGTRNLKKMNMLAFIVPLMALIVIGHVTATNFGLGSNYFPSLSGGWGGGYSFASGFGGFMFPSSYGYLPKGVQNPFPVSFEGGYGGNDDL
ncbi:hypothetical protein CHS0354_007941 [Potamilus streckersoni]|uniref:Uncharacterized protein n=1 Tax=Potamilus streckersoni TaxID=2493646 RepID=A0AAE0S8S2_9BIVA|nr:hypothetical protein CHS0354_007941 [Potamilus streckersoni]